MNGLSGPTLLTQDHSVEGFDCGSEPLNTFLIRHALTNQGNDSARTFVALNDSQVVGYYSLAASAVLYEAAPARMNKGLARHPIPIMLMARFAVNLNYQEQGIGTGLFKDAIKRTLNIRRDMAVRAFVVHAKDETAKQLYERYGMESFEGNPFHLYFLMKDIERTLGLR